MLIGNLCIDDKYLKTCKTSEDIVVYSDSLVPEQYREFKTILHNQRYYLAQHIAESSLFSKDIKNEYIEALISNIHIIGQLGVYVDCNKLNEYVDVDDIIKYYKGDHCGK